MVRFLHSADWQLGMRRHFLDEDAQPRFDQARIDVIGRMAELSKAEKCAFAVVAGDVFESNQVEWRTIGRALEALGEFACPVYLLPANHDPFDAGSIYRSKAFARACPKHVHVLTDGAPYVEQVGKETIEIVGVPWMSKHPGRDLVGDALATLEPATDRFRVVVAHGDAGAGFSGGEDAIDLDAVAEAVGDGRLHYLALGDRHSATEIAPRVWYSGAPEATAYREVDAGRALVVELAAERCTVTPHRVGRWRFVEHRVVLHDRADLDGLQAWCDALPDKSRTSLKLRFEGTLSVEDVGALDTWIEAQRPLFAAVEERRADLSVFVQDLATWRLSGFLRAGAEELATQAAADATNADPRTDDHLDLAEDGVAARDALALLHRLSEQGMAEAADGSAS